MSDADRNAKADALVEELRRQAAGRLTLFLGAAPGVGKTYAMLVRARELQRQGVDLVIGLVETHGRMDTAALLEGLTVMPRQHITYQGHSLEELDTDALLARRPRIAVVDELAHRNVPGSRHERRWQDVEELLDAGIDVYTAVNIQHLESLNDIVQRITGVRVRETVPDALLDRRRDIRLVDLPPRELIERLHQGKVYLPEQAEHALQAFFSPANLTALRDLALQTAADRVDEDFRSAQVAQGVAGLSLRRRVLIAIDGMGSSEYMVRAGRRIAEHRGAPWSVVTVQAVATNNPARQTELDRAFALARNLGAETEVLHGSSIADTLFEHAERAGVSTLVVGRTHERPFARMFNRTLTQQLLQRGAHYELVIIGAASAFAKSASRSATWWSAHDLLLALLACGMATALAGAAERGLGLHELSMFFIVAVVVVAAHTSTATATFAATFCFLAYDFFFIEPRLTLMISAQRGVVTVLLFLVAALVAGRLASKLRMQVVALSAAHRYTTALQGLGRTLSAAADLGEVLRAGRVALERQMGATVWLRVGAITEPSADATLAVIDQAAMDWAETHGQAAGRYTNTLAGATWWVLPLGAETGNKQTAVGVVGLRFSADAAALTFEQRRLAEALVADIAQAVVRTKLVADLESARVTNETERLRSALLSSVSHDLRSPLTAMVSAAKRLLNYGAALSASAQQRLLENILLEGERLDLYIQNLLDMTRLGHTGLGLKRAWIGVDELIAAASARLRRYQTTVQLQVLLTPNLPRLWVHPALLEQALFNVLENAAKFSPLGESINITARVAEGQLQLDVRDRGSGIPEAERSRIFDMFYTVEGGDHGRPGSGLGLTIAQGMVGAHGGSVAAFAGADGVGTLIRISLPLLEPPAVFGKENAY